MSGGKKYIVTASYTFTSLSSVFMLTHYSLLFTLLHTAALHYSDGLRNHSMEKGAHGKRESNDKTKDDKTLAGSTSSSGRRSSLNIFERLRLSKQDKIAADVQKKIRAVRAAEELDRKTSKDQRRTTTAREAAEAQQRTITTAAATAATEPRSSLQVGKW